MLVGEKLKQERNFEGGQSGTIRGCLVTELSTTVVRIHPQAMEIISLLITIQKNTTDGLDVVTRRHTLFRLQRLKRLLPHRFFFPST